MAVNDRFFFNRHCQKPGPFELKPASSSVIFSFLPYLTFIAVMDWSCAHLWKPFPLLSEIFCLPWNRWREKIDVLTENSWPGEQKGPFHSLEIFKDTQWGCTEPFVTPHLQELHPEERRHWCQQHIGGWIWTMQGVNAAPFQVIVLPMSGSGACVHQVVLVHALFLTPFILTLEILAGVSVDCAQALPFMLSTAFWSMEGSTEFSFPL